jgi:hypothetical protein
MPNTPGAPAQRRRQQLNDKKGGLVTAAACAWLVLFGCSRQETNSTDDGPAATPDDPSARDAAPGPLSETAPPSTDVTEQSQDEKRPDTT